MHLYLKSYRFLDYPLRPKDLESGNCTFAILLLSKYEGTTVIKLAIGSRNINTLLVTTTEDDKMQNKTKGNHFLKFLGKKNYCSEVRRCPILWSMVSFKATKIWRERYDRVWHLHVYHHVFCITFTPLFLLAGLCLEQTLSMVILFSSFSLYFHQFVCISNVQKKQVKLTSILYYGID